MSLETLGSGLGDECVHVGSSSAGDCARELDQRPLHGGERSIGTDVDNRSVTSVGIAEVAVLAGVSPATASRALTPGSRGVAPATRSLVEAAAQTLGYIPTPSAVSLSTGRTGAVGVLVPWVSRWFFAAAIEGMQQALHDLNYDLLLYPGGSGAVYGAGVVDIHALRKRVDGILALNVPVGADSLRTLQIPIVSVGGRYAGHSAVLIDDVEVGFTATRHLIELGHHAIGFIGEYFDHTYGFTATDDRHNGYRKALEMAGITYNPDAVVITGFSTDSGDEGLGELISRAAQGKIEHPTAIVAASDEPAIGVVHAARRRGLRVPETLSVIGVDDHPMSSLFDLTTIAQPIRLAGRLAAEVLLDHVRNPKQAPVTTMLETKLIIRGTTGGPSQRA